jgi:hypothetical protein
MSSNDLSVSTLVASLLKMRRKLKSVWCGPEISFMRSSRAQSVMKIDLFVYPTKNFHAVPMHATTTPPSQISPL